MFRKYRITHTVKKLTHLPVCAQQAEKRTTQKKQAVIPASFVIPFLMLPLNVPSHMIFHHPVTVLLLIPQSGMASHTRVSTGIVPEPSTHPPDCPFLQRNATASRPDIAPLLAPRATGADTAHCDIFSHRETLHPRTHTSSAHSNT